MKDFGDDPNLDVAQNIESGIIEVYRADPALLDVDAKDALDAPVGTTKPRRMAARPSNCHWRNGASGYSIQSGRCASGGWAGVRFRTPRAMSNRTKSLLPIR